MTVFFCVSYFSTFILSLIFITGIFLCLPLRMRNPSKKQTFDLSLSLFPTCAGSSQAPYEKTIYCYYYFFYCLSSRAFSYRGPRAPCTFKPSAPSLFSPVFLPLLNVYFFFLRGCFCLILIKKTATITTPELSIVATQDSWQFREQPVPLFPHSFTGQLLFSFQLSFLCPIAHMCRRISPLKQTKPCARCPTVRVVCVCVCVYWAPTGSKWNSSVSREKTRQL